MSADAKHAGPLADPVTKASLRRDLRRARRGLSPDARQAAHEAIADALVTVLADLPADAPIALYAARPDEVDLAPLVARIGRRFAWPRVDGLLLSFVEARATDLVPGYRGLLEPPPDRTALDPRALAAVLVPGLGFDPHGGRLGTGGGHYDRTLADPAFATALRIGIAYACQVVPALPVEPHDIRMQLLVTDLGLVPLDPRTSAC